MEILIYGHKNPDTDTICSAIAYSDLKNKLNFNTKPIRLGEINEETKFVLNYFGLEQPDLLEDISGREVILIDHNERSQTADGFEEAKVLELIDHHRIANFNVSDPLKVRVEPVGCTATIILDLYKENGMLPSKTIAGLMFSAIVSDTLLFKSPTCTVFDVNAGHELAKIAELDLNEYGLSMLKAGTNLSHKTEKELLNMDMKIFELDNLKLSVAQVNTVNEAELLEKKDKIISEMEEMIKEQNLSMSMFLITNILTNDSIAIVRGERSDISEKAFGAKLDNDEMKLPGVVSRKKQIIPPLTNASKK